MTAARKKNVVIAVMLTLSVLLFAGGLVRRRYLLAEQGKRPTIGLIVAGMGQVWWGTVIKGAEDAAAELGMDIKVLGPENETDRERQVQLVDDLLMQRVDAIVVAPNDRNALVKSVSKVRASGRPCVLIDADIDSDDYDSLVATDNYGGGVKAARRMGELLNGRGRVILQHYIQNSITCANRAQGFKDTIAKEFPDIKIVAEQYCLGSTEDCRQRDTDMLATTGDVNGAYAVNHGSSIGAYKAILSSGKAGKIKFVAFDSDGVLVDGMEDGVIDFMVVQDPYRIGYDGVKVAAEVLAGRKVNKSYPIDSMGVDRSNLPELKKTKASALGL
ncbi:MAG: substrate-binding domain-containing protein [Victivallaceae bacterium]|nr:substrate-binding domain-containing protein [Victivallaceae bacterium]